MSINMVRNLFLISLVFFLLAGRGTAGEIDKGVKSWAGMAIEKSRPMKILLKKIELAEGKVWQAKRNLFPEITFSYQDRQGKISGLEYDGISYKGKLNQKIFDGGRSGYTLAREEMALEKARREYEKLRGELIYKVSQAYWKVVQARLSRQSFEAIFKDIEGLLSQAESIYREELISGQEFLEINSQFLKALVKKNTLERDEALALLTFSQAVNLKEGEAVAVEREIPFTPVEVPFSTLWEMAQQNRLEWRISYLEKEMSRLNYHMARRENWPEVGVTFSYGSSAEDYKFNHLDLDDEWQVLGKVTLNIGASSLNYNYDRESLAPVVSSFRGQEIESHTVDFSLLDRLDKGNRIREEEIRLEEAGEAQDEEEKKIKREVEEAYFNLKRAKVQVEAASKELSLREREEEIVSLKKGMGKASLVELVAAKINLGESKNYYLMSLSEYIIAIAELNRSIGQPFCFPQEN